MTSSLLAVRDAIPGDAEVLSRIHVETWEDTYIGQVPDELAHERVAAARDRDWVEHAARRASTGGGVLVLLDDDVVTGFCEFGPTEDGDDDGREVGHIMRLYVHPSRQGRGGGRVLLESACARLAAGGHVEVTLWTLEATSNRAHGFYAHLGWQLEAVRTAEAPPDVRYRRRLP